jgi:hypothetical protein
MTPAERVVVEAAQRWTRWRRTNGATVAEPPEIGLQDAVNALWAERADPATSVEQTITWDQVVVGDEIYSAKTRKWYPVTATLGTQSDGRVKIWATGLPKFIRPAGVTDVQVRRSAMGRAVDMFASVLWSGHSAPDAVPVKDPGPTFAEVDLATDPEASED